MDIDWSDLLSKPFEMTDEEVIAPWFVACETISGFTHLRITAQGRWTLPAPKVVPFDPDAGAAPAIPTGWPQLSGVPVGALVGKIGGGSAGVMPLAPSIGVPPPPPWPVQLDEPFLVGKLCILAIPDKVVGPLYLGFNTPARPMKVTSLKVTVEGATPSFPAR